MWMKPRGVGASFKGGADGNYNYFLMKKSRTVYLASNTEYLTKDGLISKFLDGRDFINTYNWDDNLMIGGHGFYQNTLVNDKEKMVFKNGRVAADNRTIIGGKLAEVYGVNLNGDPDKARGKRALQIHFEEFGNFKDADKAWLIARPSVEEGEDVFGQIIGYGTGGCVCAGTKVWNNEGNLVNIENLVKEEGILGFDKYKVSKEEITWMQPPAQKQCFKITTNTERTLECSDDHPIYTVIERLKSKTILDFVETKNLKINNKIAIIDEVPIYGINKMWNPRLIGLLISDGSYGHNQSVRLSNCDDGVHEYLKKLGIINQTKNKKTLPLDIHSYCKEDICELLGGLFDADGYINIRENKKRSTYIGEISISSSSKSLLTEIRFLLQKLGVHGRIRERLPKLNSNKKIKDVNSWFEFVVADTRSLLIFTNNIKLLVKHKQDKLNKINAIFSQIKINRRGLGYRLETITNIENIGIKPIYNLTAGTTHTYIANGIITHNTEGAGFAALEKMFYDPETYNAIAIENKWDDNVEGTFIGFFTPAYKDIGFIDENGNSLEAKAKAHYDKQRETASKSTDGSTILRVKAEKPYNPREATLITSGNPFLRAELITHLNNSLAKKTDNNAKTLGIPVDLVYTSSGVEHRYNNQLNPIDTYPFGINKQSAKLTKQLAHGCSVIYHLPYKDPKTKRVPPNLYYACYDPYKTESGLDAADKSLGAVYILENSNNLTSTKGDVIVASYIGRPDSLDDFHNEMFKLLQMYNAKVGVENNVGGVYDYAKRNKLLQFLEKQFTLGFSATLATKSTIHRAFGMHMTKARKADGIEYLKDWLYEKRAEDLETGEILLNLHTISDIGLLQELSKYNDTGNFDRISALIVGMFYKKELIYQNRNVNNSIISSGIEKIYSSLSSGYGNVFS